MIGQVVRLEGKFAISSGIDECGNARYFKLLGSAVEYAEHNMVEFDINLANGEAYITEVVAPTLRARSADSLRMYVRYRRRMPINSIDELIDPRTVAAANLKTYSGTYGV